MKLSRHIPERIVSDLTLQVHTEVLKLLVVSTTWHSVSRSLIMLFFSHRAVLVGDM